MLTRLRNSTQELPCLNLHTSSALWLRAWSVRSTSDGAPRLTHSWRMRFPVSARRSAGLSGMPSLMGQIPRANRPRRHKGLDPITTRQGEKLLEPRNDAEYYSAVRGFSVRSLFENC